MHPLDMEQVRNVLFPQYNYNQKDKHYNHHLDLLLSLLCRNNLRDKEFKHLLNNMNHVDNLTLRSKIKFMLDKDNHQDKLNKLNLPNH